MATALSSLSALMRPGARGGKTKTTKAAERAQEAAAALREWLPITPKGSWERTSELVLNAARAHADFGGGVDGVDTWCISLWASYPDKSAVVIANSTSGKLWVARYAIDADDNVTFSAIKPAESSVVVTEALRRNRER